MNTTHPPYSSDDVIIIGAGLSGLIAAAYLSKEGAYVLVCEQAAQVGGLFNSFLRQGYQFDGGIKAVENSAGMMPMLAQLGLLERISFQRSPIALITGGCVQPVRGLRMNRHISPCSTASFQVSRMVCAAF